MKGVSTFGLKNAHWHVWFRVRGRAACLLVQVTMTDCVEYTQVLVRAQQQKDNRDDHATLELYVKMRAM